MYSFWALLSRMCCVVMFLIMALPVSAEPNVDTDKKTNEAAAPKDQPLPKARLCTGRKGNNYYRLGQTIQSRLKGQVVIELVETRGSWENIERIDLSPRQCDAVIAQEDAYALHRFEKPDSNLTMNRMATIYPEHVHLLCNRGIKAKYMKELDPSKHPIITNEYGSGSYITWRLFQRLNPFYKKFKVEEKSVDEAMLSVVDASRPACFFFVSGLGGRTLMTADETFGMSLKLVGIDDPKVRREIGPERRRIYRASVLPKRWYRNLGGDGLKTPVVDAVFFVSPEWKARYPKASAALASLMLSMMIEKRRAIPPGRSPK